MAPKKARRESSLSGSAALGKPRQQQQQQLAAAAAAAQDPYAETKSLFLSRFMDALLDEVVINTASAAHASETRRRAGLCVTCGSSNCNNASASTSNGRTHDVSAGAAAENGAGGESTAPSGTEGTQANGEAGSTTPSSTPVAPAISVTPSTKQALDYYSHNPLYECLVCSRQVSSNRYAQHLAKCLGLGSKGGSTRKGASGQNSSSASREAKVLSALEARRKAMTNVGSNGGTNPSTPTRDLGEKKLGVPSLADSLGLNGNGKRAISPSTANQLKKLKTGTPPPSGSKPVIELPSMVRSQSASAFPSVSSVPFTQSPLNPHRQSTDMTNGGNDSEAPDESPTRSGSQGSQQSAAARGRSNGRGRGKPKGPARGKGGSLGRGTARSPAASVASGVTVVSPPDSASLASMSSDNTDSESEAEGDEDDDSDEEDDDEEDEEGSDDEAEDDALSSASEEPLINSSRNGRGNGVTAGGIERTKGSDGEFMDVESASEQSDADF